MIGAPVHRIRAPVHGHRSVAAALTHPPMRAFIIIAAAIAMATSSLLCTRSSSSTNTHQIYIFNSTAEELHIYIISTAAAHERTLAEVGSVATAVITNTSTKVSTSSRKKAWAAPTRGTVAMTAGSAGRYTALARNVAAADPSVCAAA